VCEAKTKSVDSHCKASVLFVAPKDHSGLGKAVMRYAQREERLGRSTE
jgi:hypothetical protein